MLVKRKFIRLISNKISNPKVILEIGSRDALQSIELSKLFPKAKIYVAVREKAKILIATRFGTVIREEETIAQDISQVIK